jgi:hypothetical protein
MNQQKTNLDAISDADIAAAIQMDDLDAACRHLQDIAGITDGGVASVCFRDINFDWKTADRASREQRIRAWLQTERHYT